jgi:hypothetical protein
MMIANACDFRRENDAYLKKLSFIAVKQFKE